MRKLLEYILAGIVSDTDYEIEEESHGDSISFTIQAEPDIIGLLIGKNGKTVRSVRNLLRVRATLENKVVNLTVIEATK